jgi:hypothetical protein
MRTEADLNRIAGEIINAAIAVHRVIGPGCFESAYVACLAYEFRKRGIEYQMKVPITIQYEELTVSRAYEADFIVRGDLPALFRLSPRAATERRFANSRGRDKADRE